MTTQPHESNNGASSSTISADSTALNNLKNEILNDLNINKRASLSLGSTVISVVLGLLALIALSQAVQSAALYNKLKSGGASAAAAAAPTLGGASGSGANSSSNLPGMVGGC